MKMWGVLLVCCVIGSVFAGSPDNRVKNRLDSRDFKYKITDSGDFRIIVELDNGRTQLLFVNSETETLNNMEIREVWSVGYKGSMTAAVMRNMLRRSEKLKIGAWGINEAGDRGYFTAKIPANLETDDLIKVIFVVGEAADELEKDVVGTDDL